MNPYNIYKEHLFDLVRRAWLSLSTTKIKVIERKIRGIQLPQGVAILDIETTGLEPDVCELVSYGIIKENRAKVVIRITGEEEELLEHLRNDLEGVNTLYAFYVQFEETWLRFKLGDSLNFQFKDLKRTSGRLKDIVPFDWNDYVDGKQIPSLWQNWKERLSFGSLSTIIHHNMADLMRELILFVVLWNDGFNGVSISEEEWNCKEDGSNDIKD
jgi:uncharacterized protein YprB with RNaseH-like and TPR domain